MGRQVGRGALAVTAGLVAFALSTASASGSTFCVPDFGPGCKDNGFNIRKTTVEAAVQAKASDGIADAVVIQPGKYVDPDTLEFEGTDHLVITGAGTSETILTSSDTGNIFVVNMATGGRDTLMRNLTIRIPASLTDDQGSAIQVDGDSTLANVNIVSRNERSDGAASWVEGGSYEGGVIRGEKGGSIADAIRASAPNPGQELEIEHVTTRGASTGVSAGDGDISVSVDQSKFLRIGATGVTAGSGGVATVENTLITTREEGAFTPSALSVLIFGDVSATLTARHVTARSLTASSEPALWSAVIGNGNAGNATLSVSSSIFKDYGTAYERAAPSGVDGNANLTLSYNDYFPDAAGTSTGDGTITNTAPLNQDPLFLSPKSMIPGPGSPVIDTGNPGSPTLHDFLGGARPADGDGNGTPAYDRGAYEVDLVAPETTIKRGPGNTADGDAVFKLGSTDVASRFKCRLDQGAFKNCRKRKRYPNLAPGAHTFRAFATDPFGTQDLTPAVKHFTVQN